MLTGISDYILVLTVKILVIIRHDKIPVKERIGHDFSICNCWICGSRKWLRNVKFGQHRYDEIFSGIILKDISDICFSILSFISEIDSFIFLLELDGLLS